MHRPRAPRTRVALALSLSLLALASTVGVTLSRSPVTVARSNLVDTLTQFQTVTGPFAACQGDEALPAHVTAIRLSLDAVLGPQVELRALQGRRLLTEGRRGAGWTAADVTVPVRPLAASVRDVSICFAFRARYESVGLIGEPVPSARTTRNDTGLIKIEYLRPGERSWLARAASVADRMGFGHAWSGGWNAPALAVAMAAIVAAVSWSAIRLAR
jgi:hypothetical protein